MTSVETVYQMAGWPPERAPTNRVHIVTSRVPLEVHVVEDTWTVTIKHAPQDGWLVATSTSTDRTLDEAISRLAVAVMDTLRLRLMTASDAVVAAETLLAETESEIPHGQ